MSKLSDMKRRVKRLNKHPDKTWDPKRKTLAEVWEARLRNYETALTNQARIRASSAFINKARAPYGSK